MGGGCTGTGPYSAHREQNVACLIVQMFLKQVWVHPQSTQWWVSHNWWLKTPVCVCPIYRQKQSMMLCYTRKVGGRTCNVTPKLITTNTPTTVMPTWSCTGCNMQLHDMKHISFAILVCVCHTTLASNMRTSHDMSTAFNLCVGVAFSRIVRIIFRAMLCARRNVFLEMTWQTWRTCSKPSPAGAGQVPPPNICVIGVN